MQFRDDNTDGYSPAQLAELNRRFDAEVAKLTAEQREEKSLLDAIAERTLKVFDSGSAK